MLALHGFEAYGLDISETGVIEAKKYVSAELEKPQDYNFGEFKHPVRENAGPVSFYTADFFSDWNNGLQFDIVYDYTVSFFYPCILYAMHVLLTNLVPLRITTIHACRMGKANV
jgi:hypothetical protein